MDIFNPFTTQKPGDKEKKGLISRFSEAGSSGSNARKSLDFAKPTRHTNIFKTPSTAITPPVEMGSFGQNMKDIWNQNTKSFENFSDKTNKVFKPVQDIAVKPSQTFIKNPVGTNANKAALGVLNDPNVQSVMKTAAERTSGTGLYSTIQSIGSKTFEDAYRANREAQAGDPSKFNQFLYQLGDSAPQTLFGVALNFIPYGGKTLSTAYWTALSANEQAQSNDGRVESLNPIAIDVLGDRVLGNSLEGLFKSSSKSLLQTVRKTFAVESGTEVAQDLLKFQEEYLRVETLQEKAAVLAEAKKYFTSGQILMTAGVAGITGGGIGAGTHLTQQSQVRNQQARSRFSSSVDQQDRMFQPPVPTGQPTNTQVTAREAVARGVTENDFVKSQENPKTVNVWIKSKFSDKGAFADVPVIRTEKDITLYQGGVGEDRQFWTSNKKYAEQFGDVTQKRGTFHEIENGNTVTDVYVEAKTTDQLRADYQEVSNSDMQADESAPVQGAGQEKLSRFLNDNIKNGTFFPEDVALLEDVLKSVDDTNLNNMKYVSDGRMKKKFGTFKMDSLDPLGKIKMQGGLAKKGQAIASRVFVHEFGHSGYYSILSEEERASVDDIYRESGGKKEAVKLFEGGMANNPKYHANNPQEFFAESFAEYVFQNKVPAQKMRPLLQRITQKLFDGLKRLVSRMDAPSISRLQPLFEKILSGNSSSPLSEFASKEPASFRQDLHALLNEDASTEQGGELQMQVEQISELITLEQNRLDSHPGKKLQRFQSTKEGGFLDFTDSRGMSSAQKGKNSERMQKIRDIGISAGIDIDGNPDAITELIEEYGNIKQSVVDLKEQKARLVAQVKAQPKAPAKSIFTAPKTTQEPVQQVIQQTATEPTPTYASNKYPEAGPGIVEPESLEEAIKPPTRTPVKDKIGFVEDISSPVFTLTQLGLRDNYIELKKADLAVYKANIESRKQLREWMDSVPKESNEKIFRFLDGEKITLVGEELRVAGEIKKYFETVADKLGLSKEQRITNYITHIFPKDGSQGIPEEIALFIRNKIPGEVYNQFLLERLGAEGYIRDTWTALEMYSKVANRKINMDPALANFQKATRKIKEDTQLQHVTDYIHRVNMRPTVMDAKIDVTIQKMFGTRFGTRNTRAITLAIRKTISRAKIANSMVTFAKNLTQGVNTFSELGSRYTAVGYIELATKGSAEIIEEGILRDSFANDQTYSAVKRFAEKADKVLFANMNSTELVNRGAAYYGAKAKYLAGKITVKEVKKALNKDVTPNYELTERDARDYGVYIAENTQFVFGALDTPLFLSSDLMKTAFQFQTFTIKQNERIIRQISDKEWAKFARYILASTLLFRFVGGAFGMGVKDVFPYVTFGAPPVVDFVLDLWKAGVFGEDKWGNKLTPGERASAVGKSLFTNVVPMGAQMKRTYEGVGAVNAGESTTKSGKTQYEIDQTPMNYVRAALFGKHNLPEAKEYRKEQDQKKKDSADKRSGNSSSSSSRF